MHFPNKEKISVSEDIYPKRLQFLMGKKAPVNLHLMGNIKLLDQATIGFCGSRKATEKGIETVKDCSIQAAMENVVVVSGNAAGVDFNAHYSCLEAGGSTILVLPEGINHFRVKKAFEPVWDWDRVLVISQFEPDHPWKAYRAMARNNLIIGLSRSMIVIEAGDKGGTLHAGKETLKFGIPLYVAEYQDMSKEAKGNKILLDMGGERLAKSAATGKASMKKIFEAVKKDQLLKEIPKQEKLL